ncbi:MAG: SprT family zinc-dependent metalloprotease [Actinomycetota bacterium]
MGLNVEVVHSKRKNSVGFSVKWPDILIVSAPRSLMKNKLEEMVNDRQDWAEKRLAKLATDYCRLKLPKYYAGGELFPYLGQNYLLTVVVSGRSARPKCVLSDQRFVVEIKQSDDEVQSDLVKKALDKWYRRQAEAEIGQAVERWSQVIGKAPLSVRIRNQRSRWGSCSRKGSVNFNWRLVMLPPDMLDYVVVHELYHLKQPDHSPRFWSLLEKTVPDFKQKRKRLREYSPYLDFT